MAAKKLSLSRDQLATFLTTHEQIKQFEDLFASVDEISTDTIQQLTILGDLAITKSNLALASIQKPNIDYIDFAPNVPHTNKERRLVWDKADKTIEIGMEYDVTQSIGMDSYARVENMTGTLIPKGSAVGFVGVGAQNVLSAAPYLADGSTPSLYILGIMAHDLPDSGEVGYCAVWGHVRNVDTSAFSVGDVLYPSPTVAGALTNVKPTAPDNVIPIAAVLKVGTTDGEIFVRPTIQQQKYYGEFSNSTGVTPASANTAYALAWDNTEIADGISVGGTPATQLTVSESGLYQFNARMQFSSTSANTKSAWVWYRLNGTTNYPRSAVVGTLANNNGYQNIPVSQFFTLNAGEYIELMWAVDDTTMSPTNVAATAFAPSSPCAMIEITQVQQ